MSHLFPRKMSFYIEILWISVKIRTVMQFKWFTIGETIEAVLCLHFDKTLISPHYIYMYAVYNAQYQTALTQHFSENR